MVDKTKSRQQSLPLMVQTGIKSAIKELHTSIPGIIQEFDPVTQFAKVDIAIKRIKASDGSEVQINPIVNVPVYFQRSGGFEITFPILKGTECWVHFSERSLDNWKRFGEIRRPIDLRFHDYQDAFAVPCVTSQKNKIESFDNENVVIKNKNGDNTSTITMKQTGETEVKVVGASKTVTLTLNTDGTITVGAESVTFSGDINAANINVTGDVRAKGEVEAGPDGTSVKVTTHMHPTAALGPPSSPTPGT